MKKRLNVLLAILALLFAGCHSNRLCQQSPIAKALKDGILNSKIVAPFSLKNQVAHRELIIEKFCERISKTQKLMLLESHHSGYSSGFLYNYDENAGYSFTMKYGTEPRDIEFIEDTTIKFGRVFNQIKEDPVPQFELLKPIYRAKYVYDASPIFMHYVDLIKGINYYDVLKFGTN